MNLKNPLARNVTHSITFTEASFGNFHLHHIFLKFYSYSFHGFILYQGYSERQDLFWSICGPTYSSNPHFYTNDVEREKH